MDLIASDPDFVVRERETHDVVDERFYLPRCRRDAELLRQELFDHAGVRQLVEACVEGENGTGAFEAVPGEVEFFHGVDVLGVEFYCRAVWGVAEPEVEVFAFAGFEEEDVVAVVEVGEFVELGELGFCVEFGVFAGVGEEGVQVGEEVAVSTSLVVRKGYKDRMEWW